MVLFGAAPDRWLLPLPSDHPGFFYGVGAIVGLFSISGISVTIAAATSSIFILSG
jgi:hypothetical protein